MKGTPRYYDLHRPVFGAPTKPVHGQVMAGVWLQSIPQARLLQRVLQRGMQDFAGRHEETFLAKCFNELELTIAQARREEWAGWEDPTPSPEDRAEDRT